MLNSVRGRIQPPDLDDRTWQDIVDETRALIPKYAPQWTDHNSSDIGITLIELFAWLVEGLTYRLNRVPEKNYIAFLNLLGITREPAVPAHAYLTFTAQPAAVVVPKGKQAQTQGTEADAPIIFETDEDVTILPLNLKTALNIVKGGSNPYTNISNALAASPANGLLVTVANGQSVQLCLGFDQQTAAELRLRIQLHRPVLVDPPPGGAQASISWHYSSGALSPSAWTVIPTVTDDTNGLQRDGIVRLTLPADWAGQAPNSWANIIPATPADLVTDARFWIGIRIISMIATPIQIGIDYMLFNSVSAHNALTTPVSEPLGQSNGKPFQIFPLKNRPLFKRPNTDTPYNHLVVQVDGTTWTMVDDLPAGAGNFYRLDPVAGEISFGNFDATSGKGHGSIPPKPAQITAVYRYVVGGVAGNVGAGMINEMRSHVDGIVGVTNLFSSFDAADEEPIEDTLRRAPETLKIRDRAVTAEDYEFLARAATTDVAIVCCLEPHVHGTKDEDPGPWAERDPWTFAQIDRSPGNVNMIIVPDQGQNVPRPEPTKDLIREVLAYLDKRRNLTAQLAVKGPCYLPVKVVVNATVWKKAKTQGLVNNENDVKIDMLNKLQQYLHPVHGGLDGKGWQMGQSVFIADLFKAILPSEDIGFISSLTLEAEIPAYHFPPLGTGNASNYDQHERPFSLSTPGPWVRVADYELICYGTSSTVTVGTL